MPKCYNMMVVQLRKPIVSTGEVISHVNVPCGKCVQCIKRRRMEWCFRMEQELKVSKCAYFVTFTYDSDNVPWDTYGNMILLDTTLNAKKNFLKVNGKKPIKDKYLRKMKFKGTDYVDRSIQGYFKRLRINSERYKDVTKESYLVGLDMKRDKIKYFVCGEYGDKPLKGISEKHGRPHFHAIIFNASRRLIIDNWKFGNVDVSVATARSIAYCTKYMDKWKDKKQDWKRPREFNNASEGLGLCFVEKMKDWYKRNLDINYVVNSAGVKIPMPRYFRLKMFTDDELNLQTGIIYRAVLREKEDFILRYGEEKFIRHEKMQKEVKEAKFKRQLKKRDL